MLLEALSEGHRCLCARCCVLQADSEDLKQSWLGALQGSIDLAYRDKAQHQQAGSILM